VGLERSAFEKARSHYKPSLPKALASGDCVLVEMPEQTARIKAEDQQAIREWFQHSLGKAAVSIEAGNGQLPSSPLTVGVVLSGGQAPGGHNVIAGLLDALKAMNPECRLLGFEGGPIGVITDKCHELTPGLVDGYRNTGGFDMIGTGRDKIEGPDDLAKCRAVLTGRHVNALVIIGGDDSNTNAALLAEYFLDNGVPIQVIGVPKTIDGDLRNHRIEMCFGFDTAAKTYAELTGNICRDCLSAKKYWHVIRLMGRAASHITLEVALQTHPNVAIISEEVEHKHMTLAQVVAQLVDVICRRAAAGKNYGTIVVPEGLLEFLADMKQLIEELNLLLGTDEAYIQSLPDHSERAQHVNTKLTASTAQAYASLPESIQEALLRRDNHGNVPLSQIETDKLLIDLVSDQLRLLQAKGQFAGRFTALSHFLGYEGRCTPPSNFDSTYAYALGHAAVQLIRGGLTGYTVAATGLTGPPEEWVMGGVPVTSMLNVEIRGGKEKPVIKKTLVDLEGKPFRTFAQARDRWAMADAYLLPGPIQYFGPPEICNAVTKTLVLEHS